MNYINWIRSVLSGLLVGSLSIAYFAPPQHDDELCNAQKLVRRKIRGTRSPMSQADK